MRLGVRKQIINISRASHIKPLAPSQVKRILRISSYVRALYLPVLTLSLFVICAQIGLLAAVFPWLHIVALLIFTGWFMKALRTAQERYSPYSSVERRRHSRRAEDLPPIPLEIADVSLLTPAETRDLLWLERAVKIIKKLMEDRPAQFAGKIIYENRGRLLRASIIMAIIAAIIGWSHWGVAIISTVSPDFAQISRKWTVPKPVLSAWITPPEYTGLPPMIIATPAGALHTGEEISIPKGSTVKILFAEGGSAPVLQLNDQSYDFEEDGDGNYLATEKVESGRTISISRGWKSLGYWHIKVADDASPKIAFTASPSASERKTVQLSYQASDDFGIEHLFLIVSPIVESSAINFEPEKISLVAPSTRESSQVIFQDLTSNRFAGLPVTLQLQAEDGAGNSSFSEKVSFKLPERRFAHPLAKALADERKTLLIQDDRLSREEAIGLMASIARQPESYRNDRTVMMALRTGAMRLFLGTEPEVVPAVAELMWQAAIKIEDGDAGLAQEKLRKTLDSLAVAFDLDIHTANTQQLIDRTQQELIQYIEEVAKNSAEQSTKPAQDIFVENDRVIAPEDLQSLFQKLRGLSASGDREAARQKLTELRLFLENIHIKPLKLSTAQKTMLQQFNAIKTLSDQQRSLLEDTYRNSQMGKNPEAFKRLAGSQQKLERKLNSIIDQLGEVPESLIDSADAMSNVVDLLTESDDQTALRTQIIALNMLRRGMIEILSAKPRAPGEISQK